jgi:hypothetical protein
MFFFVEVLTGPQRLQWTLRFGPQGSCNGTKGGGLVVFLFVEAWQVTQVATCWLMSVSILGHQNSPCKRSVVLNLPPCQPIQLLCAAVKISFLMAAGPARRKSVMMTCPFCNEARTYKTSLMSVAGRRQCADFHSNGSSNIVFGIAGSSLIGFKLLSVCKRIFLEKMAAIQKILSGHLSLFRITVLQDPHYEW